MLNNIANHDQPSGMHRSPPGVTKNFQIRKIQRFDKSETDISHLIIECYGRDESCRMMF